MPISDQILPKSKAELLKSPEYKALAKAERISLNASLARNSALRKWKNLVKRMGRSKDAETKAVAKGLLIRIEHEFIHCGSHSQSIREEMADSPNRCTRSLAECRWPQ